MTFPSRSACKRERSIPLGSAGGLGSERAGGGDTIKAGSFAEQTEAKGSIL